MWCIAVLYESREQQWVFQRELEESIRYALVNRYLNDSIVIPFVHFFRPLKWNLIK